MKDLKAIALSTSLNALDWAAVTNEHNARVSTIMAFKAAGLKAGYPDLHIWWIDEDNITQLRYLEVKTKKGKLSTTQKEFLETPHGKNVEKAVCYGYDDCKETINNWLVPLLYK